MLKKGLFFVIVVFLAKDLSAQKTVRKTISSNVDKIAIEFNVIDQLELISTNDNDNQIVVYYNSENIVSSNVSIINEYNKVVIKNIEGSPEEYNLEIDKLCSIQPNYASYKIEIPRNKDVEVTFTNGNFYANNFKGDLTLKVEEGIVSMNNFKGSVFVHINIGNVSLKGIKNTKIEARSNLGTIFTNFPLKNRTKNSVNGLIGIPNSFLKVKAILANISLETNL